MEKTDIMKKIIAIIIMLLAIPLTGCVRVLKADITQGNIVTQSSLNKLKPGMTTSEVTDILGSPVLINTFSDHRMDYIYTNQPGYEKRTLQRITCYFKDDKLVKVFGHLHPTDTATS